MRIVTHDSRFHTDDIFAVATLLLSFPEAEVIRSRNPEVHATAEILVDTGMQYDPDRNVFDHHQPGGAGVRRNGIPYASFGLVWKKFGEKLSGSEQVAEIIEKKLVQPIDAHDNGIAIAECKFDGIKEYDIGEFLNSFVESPEPEHLDEVFIKVVGIAKEILVREIKIAERLVEHRGKIDSYYNQSADKRLIVLEENLMGWKEFFRDKPEVLYVIHPRPDGKWSLGAVQDEQYVSRKPLPESWAGKKDEELQRVTGVAGALFTHSRKFMAAAKTKKDAVKLAEIALNA